MKLKSLVIPLAAVVMAVPLLAASYSGINWSWGAPPAVQGVTIAGYNVYALPNTTAVSCTNAVTLANLTGPSATFTKQNASALVTTTSFKQTPYPTAPECFAVTAVSAAGVEGQPAVAFFDPSSLQDPGKVQNLVPTPF